MSDIILDRAKFMHRMKLIYEAWNDNEKFPSLETVDAIVSGVGSDEGVVYSKSTALQTWLFGYELNDTLCLLCRKKIFILSSKKKIDFLRQLDNNKENQNALPAITLAIRDKTDKDAENFKNFVGYIKESGQGRLVGEFSKDAAGGEFMEGWSNVLKSAKFEKIDISAIFALIMAPKDEMELSHLKKACDVTCQLYTKYLKEQIIDIVDSEKNVRHSKLADGCDEALTTKKYLPAGVDSEFVDMCYPPIIQSGGTYQLKFSIMSDKRNLHFCAILCSLGTRYKSYCSNIVRTILVDPSKELQDIYELLLETEDKVLEALKPGAKFPEIYEAAVSNIKSKRPQLLDQFTKNVGFVMGIEFREGSLLLGQKTTAVVETGMVFNINMGFSELENPTAKDDEGKTVALFLGDTVIVNADGPAVSLTEAAKKRVKSACLFFKNEDTPQEDNSAGHLEEMITRNKRHVILQDQLRKKQTGEDKRKLHQKELMEAMNTEAKARLAQAKEKAPEHRSHKSNISYKNALALPGEDEISQLRIYVDRRSESVILPIFGVPTPFHISMIKNISQSVEGDFTYLRINFFHPGATINKSEGVSFPKPESTFLKELTYRSSNLKEPGEMTPPSSNLNTAFRLIKEVQKKFKTREAEEREKEGIIKQDKLVLSTNKANPRLKDLYIRPNIVTKRISGYIEAHVNGFRYTSIRGDKVDILYNNIKHAFFQPCDKEMIILLHFHLKHAILFGKKKHSDIQFYTEVGEITTDLGKHQHMHDRDDLYAEQAERDLRHRLNVAFKSFCEKVEKLTNQEVEFDTPFRELGFHGVPYRSAVLLQPTSGCLVNLTDVPPFVVTLEEVELVHFERVSFQHKNFDMVFVFKDYTKKPAMVTAIPTTMLDHVKEWLDSCDIRYTEGIQSLNWAKIMKTIVDDPEGFFENGGWNFLGNESDEDAENEESSSEEDEQYRPSDEDDEDEEESDDDYDSNASEDEGSSESGSAAGGSGDESDETGKSWSELEEEARRADLEDSDEDRGKKRKASPAKKAPPPKAKKR